MIAPKINTTVPSKLPKVTFYLPEQLRRDLEKLAKIRRRSMSNLIVVLLENEVKQAKDSGEFYQEIEY
ncbi:ribbon-helix-helix domain-containing protein [[Phormidium] sp. LEGE 05292]|uniref:ribbon-helix-helix domain-containing protein n=1 Tax=[Phormidium] sp. LEGE 05292 TaxID=767427 RepID=UPI002AD27A82|nr:hypothetical protein [Phormidium sp. LEGE 05292]